MDDLYAYTNLTNVKYQPAYKSLGKLKKAKSDSGVSVKEADFTVEITKVEGATIDSEKVVPDMSKSYCVLEGNVQLPSHLIQNSENLQLYAKYKKKYYEISFPSLKPEDPGIDGGHSRDMVEQLEFYIAFRRHAESKGKMKLILVDTENKIEYQVGTLNIS